MEPGYFCEIMGFPHQTADKLLPVWEIAHALAEGKERFFDTAGMLHYCKAGGLSEEVIAGLVRMDQEIHADIALRLYAEAVLYGLMSGKVAVQHLPYPEKKLGDRAGMFFLLVTLGTFPIAEESYRKQGIPLRYLEDFALFFPGAVAMYAAGHQGKSGITPAQLAWMRNFALARKLRIGRLDYIPETVHPYVPAVFKSRRTGELAVLCKEGWHLEESGYHCTQNASDFTTTLTFSGNTVTGTPVSPRGCALTDRTRTLDLKEFEPAVTPWEWVPGCHMAGGGGMTPEKVLSSLREAKDFFKQYFHQDIRMFSCISWVLNAEWEREMPDSNIARFQRMMYMTPGTSSGVDGLFFVYGTHTPDWQNFPAENSLQKAFHRLHERRGVFRSGAMFVMTEDLDKLEENYYRNRYSF
ncbi:MAG: hypothetical protein IJV89_08620 [Lentisphaeria bacterium]|nr:hypothetical protein [Lentisphaeria bacterium]